MLVSNQTQHSLANAKSFYVKAPLPLGSFAFFFCEVCDDVVCDVISAAAFPSIPLGTYQSKDGSTIPRNYCER